MPRIDCIHLFLLLASAAMLVGCDIDSFADPSNIGRWENTPVVLPILERLDVIDEPGDEILGISEPTSQDLLPEVTTYTIGPGDMVTVTIFGLIDRTVDSVLTRRVDELGYIDLPVIQQVKASGKTPKELEQAIVDALKPDILADPIVTVVVTEMQQRTFNIIGTPESGTYTILKSNFRLIDAISLGGGLPPETETIYVIRQIALSPEAQGRPPEEPAAPQEGAEQEQDPAKVIEELAKPQPQAEGEAAAPAAPPPAPLKEAVESAEPDEDRGRYINVDGKWVLVEDTPQAAAARARGQERGEAAAVAVADADELVTQRVIEIDAEALMRGEAKQNIVIRPNDIVRVPQVVSGYAFIEGAISRPGSYAIPGERTMTLTALIAAAGGLDPVAIPERLDLYRRVGREQQAIVRLNLRAIAEGVQPNIFLTPNDEIRIGTNLYASFLAVIRNSFRMSYGFGFLLDRNFGNDVFGPPPESRFLR